MTDIRSDAQNVLDNLLSITVGVDLIAWRDNDDVNGHFIEEKKFILRCGADAYEDTAFTLRELATEVEEGRVYGWMRQKSLEDEIRAGEVRAVTADAFKDAAEARKSRDRHPSTGTEHHSETDGAAATSPAPDSPDESLLSERFGRKAKWRGITMASDLSVASISFTSEDGEVQRLRLDAEDVLQMALSVTGLAYRKIACHSDRLSGRSSSAVSTPFDGEIV